MYIHLRGFFILSVFIWELAVCCYTVSKAHLDECPVIKVENSSIKWCSKQLTFTTRVTGNDPASKLTYKWSVANGKVTEGQSTDTIKVNADEKGDVSVTVEVGGIDESCQKTAGITIGCDKYDPPQ